MLRKIHLLINAFKREIAKTKKRAQGDLIWLNFKQNPSGEIIFDQFDYTILLCYSKDT